jgi:hypothetical protein
MFSLVNEREEPGRRRSRDIEVLNVKVTVF